MKFFYSSICAYIPFAVLRFVYEKIHYARQTRSINSSVFEILFPLCVVHGVRQLELVTAQLMQMHRVCVCVDASRPIHFNSSC